ncbi:tape measure protein [Rhodocyclus tenuis]|uniref:Tape measure protein N-terminal domain-containing protein n=1 Tax=Rhodocyclus tenuis TaxID=1066 RepID=A0A840GA86_RHOTE|nr:tape measure protein [Rhodocyclus tenuis]MBB4248391.1 hypothetical protein [Rhodocyclus tenuis]
MSDNMKLGITVSYDGKSIATGVASNRRDLRDLGAEGKRAGKEAADGIDSIGASAQRLGPLLAGAIGALSVSAALGKLTAVQREFDVLNASLVTVTGSAGAAEKNFAWIKEFAKETPYSLAEVTNAFIKMKALGLDASAAALRSYGNTAAAMGKGLNQMIEAVADAATGEFERLKEFGVKANVEGSKVTLTFRGVRTEIGNNAEDIVAYLRKIGDVDFAGASTKRAETLDGAISNLGDTWDELYRTINDSGVGAAIESSVRGATVLVERLTNNVRALSSYWKTTEQQQVDQLVATREMWKERLGSSRGEDPAYAASARAEIAAANAQIAVLQRRFEAREFDNRKADEAAQLAAASAKASVAEAKAKDAATAAAKLHEKAVKEEQSAEESRLRTMAEIVSTESKRAAALADDADKLREEIATMGLSASQLTAYQVGKLEAAAAAELLTAANLREAASMIQGGSAADDARRYYLALADAREAAASALTDQAGLVAIKAEKQASVDAQSAASAAARKASEDAARDWERTAETVERSLTDALLRGFESGKGAGENLRDALENMFKTLVLRPIIQAVVSPAASAVTGALGFSSASSSSSLVNLASSNASILNIGRISSGYGQFASSSIGQSLGLSTAQSAGYMAPVYDGAGNLISAGSGTSAGGLTGVGSGVGTALSYIGPGLAAYGVAQKYGAGGGLAAGAGTVALGGAVSGAMAGTGAMAGATGALSAMGPWGWAAIAVLSILGGLGSGGGPKVGGDAAYSLTNGAAANLGDGGLFRSSNSKNAAVSELLATLVGAIPATVKALGGGDSVSGSYALGYLTDPQGSNPNLVKSTVNGRVLSYDRKVGDIQTALTVELDRMMVAALQDADLADWADKIVDQINPLTASADALSAALATLNSMSAVVPLFEAIGISADRISAAGIVAIGGYDAVATALASYYDLYFTEAEKASRATGEVAAALAAAGLAMPDTRDEFRKMVEAQDITTSSGQKAFAALMSVSAAFSSLVESSEAATKALLTEAKERARLQSTSAVDYAIRSARLTAGLPAFASGGDFTGGIRLVGEYGPELEVTGPSRIYSASQTRDLLTGLDTGTVAAEIRQLREENAAQARSLAAQQVRVARLLEGWERNGLPSTRIEL